MRIGAVEVDVMGRCLRAAADGPFFEDREFSTLFGLSRSEVRLVAERWPDVDRSDTAVDAAITNSMVNLLGYPHGDDEALRVHVPGGRLEIERVLTIWRSAG